MRPQPTCPAHSSRQLAGRPQEHVTNVRVVLWLVSIQVRKAAAQCVKNILATRSGADFWDLHKDQRDPMLTHLNPFRSAKKKVGVECVCPVCVCPVCVLCVCVSCVRVYCVCVLCVCVFEGLNGRVLLPSSRKRCLPRTARRSDERRVG